MGWVSRWAGYWLDIPSDSASAPLPAFLETGQIWIEALMSLLLQWDSFPLLLFAVCFVPFGERVSLSRPNVPEYNT